MYGQILGVITRARGASDSFFSYRDGSTHVQSQYIQGVVEGVVSH